MFRMRKTRLGKGALCTPGTTVSTRPLGIGDRRLPLLVGTVPVCPALPPDPVSI